MQLGNPLAKNETLLLLRKDQGDIRARQDKETVPPTAVGVRVTVEEHGVRMVVAGECFPAPSP